MARTNPERPSPASTPAQRSTTSTASLFHWATLLLAALVLSCEGAQVSGPRLAKTKSFSVSLQTDPAQIPVNKHFTMEFTLQSLAGAEVSEQVAVDADMPSHGHGMNTKPQLTALGGGRWRVEGMLFHMPGAWEIYVYVGRNQAMERAVFPVEL